MGVNLDRIRWNRKYSDPSFKTDWAPTLMLAERIGQLEAGRALDVACGVGANALFMAKRGWQVDALDISDVAIERLRRAGTTEGVLENLNLILGEAETQPLEAEAYDLIVCIRFLSRPVVPKIFAALKPGGLLLTMAHTIAHKKYHPKFRDEYCLQSGELLRLYADLEVLEHEEVDNGTDAFARLVAIKS